MTIKNTVLYGMVMLLRIYRTTWYILCRINAAFIATQEGVRCICCHSLRSVTSGAIEISPVIYFPPSTILQHALFFFNYDHLYGHVKGNELYSINCQDTYRLLMRGGDRVINERCCTCTLPVLRKVSRARPTLTD
jgi:hypothetical protein